MACSLSDTANQWTPANRLDSGWQGPIKGDFRGQFLGALKVLGPPQGRLAWGPHRVGAAIPQVPCSHTVALGRVGADATWAGHGLCFLPGSVLFPIGARSGGQGWGGVPGSTGSTL